MTVVIDVESPLQDDVRVLIAALNAHLLTLTPPEFCSHMTVEDMAGPDTTMFVARDDGQAIACGALRRDSDGVGEVKRMYTIPTRQGEGVGGRILERIETLARNEGLARLVLETGHVHDAASACTSAAASPAAGRCSTTRTPAGPSSTRRRSPTSVLPISASRRPPSDHRRALFRCFPRCYRAGESSHYPPTADAVRTAEDP